MAAFSRERLVYKCFARSTVICRRRRLSEGGVYQRVVFIRGRCFYERAAFIRERRFLQILGQKYGDL